MDIDSALTSTCRLDQKPCAGRKVRMIINKFWKVSWVLTLSVYCTYAVFGLHIYIWPSIQLDATILCIMICIDHILVAAYRSRRKGPDISPESYWIPLVWLCLFCLGIFQPSQHVQNTLLSKNDAIKDKYRLKVFDLQSLRGPPRIPVLTVRL